MLIAVIWLLPAKKFLSGCSAVTVMMYSGCCYENYEDVSLYCLSLI